MFKSISICTAGAAIAFATLAVGCGESGPTISKAGLIKRGDAICVRADNTEYGEIAAWVRAHPKSIRAFSTTGAPDELIRTIAVPSILKEVKELEGLGAPRGDEERIQTFISGIRVAVKKVEKDPRAIEATLPGSRKKNPSYAFNEVDRLGREYGFNACREVV